MVMIVLRHLKRILALDDLHRRKHYRDLVNIIEFLIAELRYILRVLDPEAVDGRKRRRLRR